MNTPRFATLVARWLRAMEVSRTAGSQAFERSLLTVERALALRRRRQQRRRAVAYAAAAVACAVGLLGLIVPRLDDSAISKAEQPSLFATSLGHGAWLSGVDGEVALGAGLELSAGSQVRTADRGGAELVFATGSRVRVDANSRLEVLSRDAHQRLALRSGSFYAQVAKLLPGERFVTEVPGAEVEVRGTAFRVTVVEDCAAGPRAQVSVDEGVVEVRTATETLRLAPGQSWQATCESPPEPALATQQPIQSPAPAAHSHPALVAASPASSLAEQNALFAAAVAARARGETELSLLTFARVAERFPKSALAENALLARIRLLAARDASAARSEAVRFLSRYPNSFARREVESFAEPK